MMEVRRRILDAPRVRFSIVTPSFRQSEWLRLCVRSVEDQGVENEQIIQDAGSGPDVGEWVRAETRAKFFEEKDEGIYDALNRGFARASGEIFAWLNCDEQYLPGALAAVDAYFGEHPDVDVLLADNLVVDGDGRYVAHRFSLRPVESHCWLRFPVASCALFFRRRVWKNFDTQWKSAGDWWWFMAMLRAGARVGVMRRFVSAFAETGENLGLSLLTTREQAVISAARPAWVKLCAPLLLAAHRARMWASGAFRVQPFDYQIFTRGGAGRKTFRAEKPTARWRCS